MDKTPLYFIYFPAGHIDWISRGTALAMTSDYEDMIHRVRYYHYRRGANRFFGLPEIHGPIEVKTN